VGPKAPRMSSRCARRRRAGRLGRMPPRARGRPNQAIGSRVGSRTGREDGSWTRSEPKRDPIAEEDR
jgi:hypothetical protein